MKFVEVTFNEDLNWSILLQAFEKVKIKYQPLTTEIRAVEAKFKHRFLVKIKVDPGSDIEKIKQYFKHQYNLLAKRKKQ